MDLSSVVACVAAVCSAYHDGADLVQQIKVKRKVKKARGTLQQNFIAQELAIHELEKSLHRGQGVVQDQFDFQFRRFGPAFQEGDRESSVIE